MNPRQLMICGIVVLVGAAASVTTWLTWNEPSPIALKFATGPDGGAFFTLGEEIAQIVHEDDADITINMTTDESAGSVDNMTRLASNEVQLAIVQNDTEPAPGCEIQTLIPLHRGVCHFLVPEGSTDINDIHELRGKRVAVGRKSSGNLHIVQALLEHFGVGFDEFTPIYDGIRECGYKFEAGEIDAALVITAVTSPTLSKLISEGNVRYVSMSSSLKNNEVDGFAVTYPYIEKYVIPRYVYPVHDSRHGKPQEPCVSFALRSSLVCRSDLPDNVARTIVDSIVTHRATLMRNHHEAHDITEHFDAADVQFPLHHGAVSFYQRQRPTFWERYAELMAFLLSLFLTLCGFVVAMDKWFTVRKKNRIDRYYERLDVLLDELRLKSVTPIRLDEIEYELTSMRHDAVRELVNERLLADESFQIFQSLLTNCHQQLTLQRQSSVERESKQTQF